MTFKSTDSSTYAAMAALLNRQFSLEKPHIILERINQEIYNIPFSSNFNRFMPRETEGTPEKPASPTPEHGYRDPSMAFAETIFNNLTVSDRDIPENNRFVYPFLRPRGGKPCGRVIFLFHGLNEKTWNKYLPWASRLAEDTGRGVILFPFAFHMNRAPANWSALHSLMRAVRKRRQLLPNLQGASCANIAISHRLQCAPQRFLLSAIQTYNDVLQLLDSIRGGKHPGIADDAGVDLFGYSIGANLSEVLLMADPGGHFSDSRAFLLCGGSALDRMTPVNRAIIDNHAFRSIILYFNRLMRGREGKTSPLASLASRGSEYLEYFKSLLLYDEQREKREGRFMDIYRRIKAVALKKDTVITPEAITTTLWGRNNNIPTALETLDFSFSYSHTNPFPLRLGTAANEAFNRIFSRATEFFSAP